MGKLYPLFVSSELSHAKSEYPEIEMSEARIFYV